MKLCLAMVTADGEERCFPIMPGRTILGSDPHCNVQVRLPQVAPRHCELVTENGRLRVHDLETEGGTFHNGTRVSEAVLAPDDRLTIGPVTFVVRQDLGGSGSSVAEVKPEAADRSALPRR
jgi:pSer/pThr/pTyr-binding forkhead associated (FHA) protein